MPSKPKTWKQKMQAKPPHIVRLDKDFAGVPAGARLLMAAKFRAGRTWIEQQRAAEQDVQG